MTALYWLASYPKSGNTWLRVVLGNLFSDSVAPLHINDLSIDHIASSRTWLDDILGFDTADLTPDEVANLRPAVYGWSAFHAEPPSFHKIHDACTRTSTGAWLINPAATAGSVYIIRNPLDVVVSYSYHLSKTIDATIDEMANPNHCLAKARPGKILPQTEQRLLTWSDHVLSWVDNPAIETLVVRYEDLCVQPLKSFSSILEFLRLDADIHQVALAVENSSFKILQAQEVDASFRERPAHMKTFFRKGIAGDWQSALTSQQIDKVIRQHGTVMERFGYLDASGRPTVI